MLYTSSMRVSTRRLPHPRTFTTTSRVFAPSFLDLAARSVSRENGHFSKLSGGNYIEHSPALQLLRSERDLAERKAEEQTGIIIAPPRKPNDAVLLDEYRKQTEALKAQIVAKEHTWHERYNNDRRDWEVAEERSLRLKLMFGISLVLIALLALDGLVLAEEVEQHCPGCFHGNCKEHLFLMGYLKRATDKASQWWNKELANSPRKHAAQSAGKTTQPIAIAAAITRPQRDLPAGWEEKQTPSGRAYFANHNGRYTTWDDPRVTKSPSYDVRSSYSKNGKEAFAVPKQTRQETVDDHASLWHRLMWAAPRAS